MEEERAQISSKYSSINFSNIPRFPNYHNGEDISDHLPIFWGNNHAKVRHVIYFLKILVDFNVLYEDNMIEMFVSTLRENACEWYLNCLPNKGITSLSSFLRIFLRQWHTGETTVEVLDKFLEGFIYTSLPWIEYHEEDPKLPRLIRMRNYRYWVLPPRDHNEEEIHDDSVECVHE